MIDPGLSLMGQIATFITSTDFIVIYIALIVAIFTWMLIAFFIKITPVAKSIKSTNRRIEETKNMAEFAAEFPEVDTEISSKPELQHSWHEFKETLLFPGVDLEPNEDVIHNTHVASLFFSRESIIAPRINMRFFNALPGILTGLGIMGTFIGLVAGIYLASKGLTADDIEQAKAALSTLLDGASLAFSTSIAGLFFSMIASSTEKRFLHRLDNHVAKLVVNLDKRVKRLPPEQIQTKILRENRQQTAALQSFTNDLAVKFAEILDVHVKQPMSESMDLLLESLDMLRAEKAESDQEMLTMVVDQFSDSLSGAAGSEMKALGETLSALNEQFSEHIRNNQSSQEETAQKFKSVADQLQACLDQVQKLTVENTNLVHESNTLVTSVRGGQDAIADATRTIESLATKISSLNQETIDAAGVLKDASIDVRAALENLTAMEENIQEVWADYKERFENVDEALAKSVRSIQEGLGSYSQSLTQYIQQIESELSKIVQYQAGSTKDVRESTEELADVLSDLSATTTSLVEATKSMNVAIVQ